jgi:dihydroxyacetone kinase-like protein
METGLSRDSISWAVERLRKTLEESAAELNELDGKLGDGDLGATLARASEALANDSHNLPEDVGSAFLRCAMTFSREAAGTYGTLMATGLMAVAKLTKGRTVVPWNETPSLLGAALTSMSERGRSQLGDKTVLDVLEAARQATQGIDSPDEILAAANVAVGDTIKEFRSRPFRQGRARIFSNSVMEMDDPGMIAFKRIVEGLTKMPVSPFESERMVTSNENAAQNSRR